MIDLDLVGAEAHMRGSSLSSSAASSLFLDSADAFHGTTAYTVYDDGKTDTVDGERRWETIPEFGDRLKRYAERVVVKGTGYWYTPGLSSTGRCRDEDCVGITMGSADCDGAGEWDQLRSVLDEARLGYILQRSSSHTPALPKWHLHVPLSRLVAVPKPWWRLMYRYWVGWLSAVSGLEHDLSAGPPRYGFDRTTDRLLQPWFPAARRTSNQEPPQTIVLDGHALDFLEFLPRIGFRREWLTSKRQSGAFRTRTKNVDPDSFYYATLFKEAGTLGRQIKPGVWAVRCPQNHLHSSGKPYDTSTVIFAPSKNFPDGRFVCLHSSCRDYLV